MRPIHGATLSHLPVLRGTGVAAALVAGRTIVRTAPAARPPCRPGEAGSSRLARSNPQNFGCAPSLRACLCDWPRPALAASPRRSSCGKLTRRIAPASHPVFFWRLGNRSLYHRRHNNRDRHANPGNIPAGQHPRDYGILNAILPEYLMAQPSRRRFSCDIRRDPLTNGHLAYRCTHPSNFKNFQSVVSKINPIHRFLRKK